MTCDTYMYYVVGHSRRSTCISISTSSDCQFGTCTNIGAWKILPIVNPPDSLRYSTMKAIVAALLAACLFVASDAKGLDKKWTKPKVEGDYVPNVTFKTRVRTEEETENPFDWKDITSENYFKGKRTVLFALPGAFTPTCT